jgi:type IV pilus assembly protein PilX
MMDRKLACRRHGPRQSQNGVALIIGMILLLVMTIIGLAGVRLANSEERMVAQTFDRTLAFQAAEAALREAEILIESAGRPTPAASTACTVTGTVYTLMTCGSPVATATPRWLDPTFANWTAATAVGSTTTLAITPEYFVEYLGNTYPCGFDPTTSATNCKRYRVTVRAKPGGGRAFVTLQSIYATS